MAKPREDRSEFMNSEQKRALKGLPRTHQNCLQKTGVRRPGKTAKDRYYGEH